jgi:hypothetical protein
MYQLGGKQQPTLVSEQKNWQNALIVDYFPIDGFRSIGVVKSIEEDGKTVKVWLGGLPPQVLTS